MAAQNDLAVDMASAAQQAVADTEVEVAAEAQAVIADTETVDVPESDFWGNNTESQASGDEQNQEIGDDFSQSGELPPAGMITYTENGESKTISLADAQKALSLVGGARKAFSERARIQKELSAYKKQVEEARKFQDSWDKLEDLKHDEARLYEVITGKSYADFLKETEERVELMRNANPAERIALEQETKLRRLEQDVEREKRARAKDREKVETDRYEADKTKLQTVLEREFFRNEVEVEDPQVANKVKEMHWLKSVADLKKFVKENPAGDVERAAARIMKENAAALRGFYTKSVGQQVSKVTKQKQNDAVHKAQLASTTNYVGTVSKDLSKLDPLTLFQRIRGGR